VITLTASFGVSCLGEVRPESGVADALLQQADICLYQSKQGGRNQVTAQELGA
jgi:PleD family two-component response regulator